MRHFKECKCIFQGMREFVESNGNRYRVSGADKPVYHIAQLIDNAWIHRSTIKARSFHAALVFYLKHEER